jgi:DUF4097 and DUF4098 domain-containing protein YvlB
MKLAAFITAALLAFAVWTGNQVSYAGDAQNLTSVNGSVKASAGQSYNTLSTVNGDVHVSRGASAETAKTVNGQIVLEGDSKIGNVSTVNGSLEIGDGVTIRNEASTVNGTLSIAKRSQVGGDVSTVSGEIEIAGAEVAGVVSTTNGDIDLTEGARVRGGIHVKENNSWGWGKENNKPVKVHICSTCVVEGELRFERAVELRVDDGGKIGKIVGDKVVRK